MNHNYMLYSFLALILGWVGTTFAQIGEGTVTEPFGYTNVSALLEQVVYNNKNDVLWDKSRNVVAVTLRYGFATDSNLHLLSSISTLRQLWLQPTSKDELSVQGIIDLRGLTNLASLNLSCTTALPKGVFCGVCDLKQLTRLELVAACPPHDEYSCITNLETLAELRVTYCTNFDDVAFSYVTNLSNLKRLTVYGAAVSKESTNLLRKLKLTNAVVK